MCVTPPSHMTPVHPCGITRRDVPDLGLASLGMKAINTPEIEVDFNISDKRLVILRVVLGGLFALALTFPFTGDCFIDFCYFMGTGKLLTARGEEGPFLRAFILITPFLLGFSTSLVMLVINQLKVGVLAFFGKLGPRSDAKTGSASTPAGHPAK